MRLVQVTAARGGFAKLSWRSTCPKCDTRWDEIGLGETKTVSCTRCGDGYIVSFDEEDGGGVVVQAEM